MRKVGSSILGVEVSDVFVGKVRMFDDFSFACVKLPVASTLVCWSCVSIPPVLELQCSSETKTRCAREGWKSLLMMYCFACVSICLCRPCDVANMHFRRCRLPYSRCVCSVALCVWPSQRRPRIPSTKALPGWIRDGVQKWAFPFRSK